MDTLTRIAFPARDEVTVDQVRLRAPGPHEFLVENSYSLISSGTELALFRGTHSRFRQIGPTAFRYPYYPGYCSVGVVSHRGIAVTELVGGDRVLHLGKHQSHTLCTSAQNDWIKLEPTDERPEILFARLIQIAWTAVHQLGSVPARCTVSGAGALGIATAQLLQTLGATAVEIIGNTPLRLRVAQECGLTARTRDASPNKRAPAATCIIETTGREPALRSALAELAPGGTLVLLGSPRVDITLDLYETVHCKSLRLIGAHETCLPMVAHGGEPCRRDYLNRAAALIRDGKLNLTPLIHAVLPPRELQRAYAALSDPNGSRPSFVIGWKT
jgi:2-desacetyl-2-hydroxyethyl bacteriochlorophyllide A dehydrogenase